MPIPDFVLELRELVGTRQLWLPAVTAVVRRDDEVLLTRRADNGQWALVSGILEPGEQPAIGLAREIEEETGVVARIEALAARINQRFGRGSYQPIILLRRHHEPPAVFRFYRAADLCYVSSLHDGMNLVCKEFVAARDDLQGVLVLSRFAGAARELPEALIVNPYHVEETADALHRAATMPVA